MSIDENDNPFFFELEVDDEISFKAPPQPKAPAMKQSTFVSKTFLRSPVLAERNLNASSPLSDCETPIKSRSLKQSYTPSTVPKQAVKNDSDEDRENTVSVDNVTQDASAVVEFIESLDGRLGCPESPQEVVSSFAERIEEAVAVDQNDQATFEIQPAHDVSVEKAAVEISTREIVSEPVMKSIFETLNMSDCDQHQEEEQGGEEVEEECASLASLLNLDDSVSIPARFSDTATDYVVLEHEEEVTTVHCPGSETTIVRSDEPPTTEKLEELEEESPATVDVDVEKLAEVTHAVVTSEVIVDETNIVIPAFESGNKEDVADEIPVVQNEVHGDDEVEADCVAAAAAAASVPTIAAIDILQSTFSTGTANEDDNDYLLTVTAVVGDDSDSLLLVSSSSTSDGELQQPIIVPASCTTTTTDGDSLLTVIATNDTDTAIASAPVTVAAAIVVSTKEEEENNNSSNCHIGSSWDDDDDYDLLVSPPKARQIATSISSSSTAETSFYPAREPPQKQGNQEEAAPDCLPAATTAIAAAATEEVAAEEGTTIITGNSRYEDQAVVGEEAPVVGVVPSTPPAAAAVLSVVIEDEQQVVVLSQLEAEETVTVAAVAVVAEALQIQEEEVVTTGDVDVVVDEATPSTASTTTIGTTTSKPRLSLELEMRYDAYSEGSHTAKYSQSEFDEAVAAAVAKAELTALAREKDMQTREKALQALVEKAEQAIVDQAESFKHSLADAKAAQEDAELQRTQTRALAHRMQSVESEMVALRASKAADISSLTAQYNESMLAQRQLMESAHAAEVQQMNQKLAGAEDALRVQMRESLAREEAHHNDLVTVVNAAKEKVYAKAKVQFEAGNKEFQRVKELLKEAQIVAENKQKQVDSLNDQLAETKRSLEKEQSRVTVAEKRSAELKTLLSGLLQSVATTVAAAAALTGSPAPRAFTVPADDATAEQAAVATAKDSIGRMKQDLAEVMRNKESLQAATSVLQNSLQQKDSLLASINASIQLEKDRSIVAEALLAAVKVELADTIRERDNQMTAVAKLSASFASAEGSLAANDEALQASKKECVELTERCQNLRQMNEELLGMLEGMYASQPANQNNPPPQQASSSS